MPWRQSWRQENTKSYPLGGRGVITYQGGLAPVAHVCNPSCWESEIGKIAV
jgi:hypothetical protein